MWKFENVDEWLNGYIVEIMESQLAVFQLLTISAL
jgi:hypothetical protein